MKKISLLSAVVLLASLLGQAGPANADRGTDADHLHPGRITSAPIGWTGFCARNPVECVNRNVPVRRLSLNAARMLELNEVNTLVNSMVAPVTDMENYGVLEFWTFPINNRGDCEDYVLLKRRLLIERGWPASALSVTVVLDREGAGHAVLTVLTDQGELILDNQVDRVLGWADTGLTFIKRQSAADPNVWLDLGGMSGALLTASASPRRAAR